MELENSELFTSLEQGAQMTNPLQKKEGIAAYTSLSIQDTEGPGGFQQGSGD